MKVKIQISGDEASIKELIELLMMDEAHSGEHIYEIKEVLE